MFDRMRCSKSGNDGSDMRLIGRLLLALAVLMALVIVIVLPRAALRSPGSYLVLDLWPVTADRVSRGRSPANSRRPSHSVSMLAGKGLLDQPQQQRQRQ